MKRTLMTLVALGAMAGPAAADDIPATMTIDASGNLPPGLSFVEVTGVDPAKVTKVKTKHAVERVVTWNEGDGRHVAVFATTGKVGRKDDMDFESRVLYVTTFHVVDGRYDEVQAIKEVVNPCELDLSAEFIPESITLTNLDDDDEGELTFGYVASCLGGLDPKKMKVLMLEGKQRYALRGVSEIFIAGGAEGGTYRPDFKTAPKAFLEHAERIWDKVKRR